MNRLKYGYGPAIKLHNPSSTRANSTTILLLPPHPPYSTKQYAFVPHFPPFLWVGAVAVHKTLISVHSVPEQNEKNFYLHSSCFGRRLPPLFNKMAFIKWFLAAFAIVIRRYLHTYVSKVSLFIDTKADLSLDGVGLVLSPSKYLKSWGKINLEHFISFWNIFQEQ